MAVKSWFVTTIGISMGVFILYRLMRWWAQGGMFRKPWIRIDGKVVIVTGCNTGIGKETVMELARRGARIYMACRNFEKCEDARNEIIAHTGNENIFNRTLDLASLASVRKFVQKNELLYNKVGAEWSYMFLREESRLDILINNGGVMFTPCIHTEDGFELQMGTNHLGHFLLTNLLLDTLKASAPARIINVSSMLHAYGKIHRDDFNMKRNYNRHRAYFNSKLANILFTRELSKRLYGFGVTANSLHPGLVNTELQRNHLLSRILLAPGMIISKTPKSGAQTTIALALDPAYDVISGNYYVDCKVANESAAARDDDTSDWLWKISEELTGLREKQQ